VSTITAIIARQPADKSTFDIRVGTRKYSSHADSSDTAREAVGCRSAYIDIKFGLVNNTTSESRLGSVLWTFLYHAHLFRRCFALVAPSLSSAIRFLTIRAACIQQQHTS
jgi:hypothetical protein